MSLEGAGDRTRTGDVQLGKLAFYQLNYARRKRHRRSRTKYRGPLTNQEPAVGIEPTTARLRIECSTTELRWRYRDSVAGSGTPEPSQERRTANPRAAPTIETRSRIVMPWSGLEPLCLAAPPPQDGVSTNFTTRAFQYLTRRDAAAAMLPFLTRDATHASLQLVVTPTSDSKPHAPNDTA
jgi:hypothetical protein